VYILSYEKLLNQVERDSQQNIESIHHLASKIWKINSPIEIQTICLDAWDEIGKNIGSTIKPLVPASKDHPVTNLIFGSGSFSTGKFQAQQYEKVRSYLDKPPIILQGIVSNKSREHGCNGPEIAKQFKVANINLDFNEWYHENVNQREENPIRATRYWYPPGKEKEIDMKDIENRFNIRQNVFHKILGEKIAEKVDYPTNIVSARGYNFQFCRCIFSHQKNALPHVNDTHPADLSYVDPQNKTKLYVGWQSGATERMMEDHISRLRGSLIEIEYMDRISQIHELDEGVLLALGHGVQSSSSKNCSPSEIQNMLKIIDDYFFCTLEPTGLLLLWGVTKNKIPITYQDINGNPITINQKAVVIGNQVLSGINAFGYDFKKNLEDLEQFLMQQKIIR
jgi:hypothetical protein